MPEETQNDWQNPPPVIAPSPEDKTVMVEYDISTDISGTDKDNYRRTPLFQVWAHLHGEPPPIKNVSIIENDKVQPTYQTLSDATACFIGINRPINDQENGSKVITYVLKPEYTVEYEPRMGAPIRAKKLNADYVLTVQIVLNSSLQLEGKRLSGRVTRLEIVECDTANDRLPKNHANRYGDMLW